LHYSIGFDVMALVIQRVSGMTYDAFLQKRVFAPLQMTSTGFQVSPSDARRLTTNYDATERGANSSPDSPPDPKLPPRLRHLRRSHDERLVEAAGSRRARRWRRLGHACTAADANHSARHGRWRWLRGNVVLDRQGTPRRGRVHDASHVRQPRAFAVSETAVRSNRAGPQDRQTTMITMTASYTNAVRPCKNFAS
jgi:CubicO group peptidase (beta-lactamase class C family)